MRIHSSSLIRHPRERVYKVFRDELPAVVPYMPNVREIITRAHEQAGPVIRMHNEWVGTTDIPRVAQGVVKPDMLRWDDYATWDDRIWGCDWEIKIRVFTDNFRCKGTNRMTIEGGATRVTLEGKLDISVRNVPGVPRFLAGTIAPIVERTIISLVTPNLEQTAVSIGRYLESQ